MEAAKEAAIASQEEEVLESTPPEDWMVERQLAAKRAEEKVAASCDGDLFVPKRLRVAAGEPATAELGEAKPAPVGAMKKTKLVRVHQEYIDELLKQYPRKPYPVFRENVYEQLPPEKRDSIRAFMANLVAGLYERRAKEEAILEQYHAMGYAEEEVEVSDGETQEN